MPFVMPFPFLSHLFPLLPTPRDSVLIYMGGHKSRGNSAGMGDIWGQPSRAKKKREDILNDMVPVWAMLA